jgi:cytochrome P450
MLDFDPFSAVFLHDPYEFFARYRRDAPVFHSEDLDYWVVSRYDDVKRVLRDPDTFSNQITLNPIAPWSAEVQRVLEDGGYRARPAMVGTDPPYHTRARKLMSQVFTPRRVSELEPRIRRLANERLDALQPLGRMDLVRDLTYELPALVLFLLLGVPDEDVGLVKVGADHRLLLVWGRPTAEHQIELARGLVTFWHHSERLVERRLRDPGDDLTSELLRIRGGDDSVLTLGEIASLIFGLLFAGHETTTAFITNCVRQLLERGRWDDVVRHPESIPAMVEELLRLDSSVIGWRRLALRDTTIAGVSIPAGARLLLLLGAANHDESHFADPGELDPHRANLRDHLAFGFGIHYCLGAALARAETKVVLECLAERLPSLRLVPDQPLSFHPNVAFRGPRSLAIEW